MAAEESPRMRAPILSISSSIMTQSRAPARLADRLNDVARQGADVGAPVAA